MLSLLHRKKGLWKAREPVEVRIERTLSRALVFKATHGIGVLEINSFSSYHIVPEPFLLQLAEAACACLCALVLHVSNGPYGSNRNLEYFGTMVSRKTIPVICSSAVGAFHTQKI